MWEKVVADECDTVWMNVMVRVYYLKGVSDTTFLSVYIAQGHEYEYTQLPTPAITWRNVPNEYTLNQESSNTLRYSGLDTECFFNLLQVLEAVYIRTRDPVLCRQKKKVVSLTLFK